MIIQKRLKSRMSIHYWKLKLGGLILIMLLKNASSAFCAPAADSNALMNHVLYLSNLNPPRSSDYPSSLNKAAEYIEGRFRFYGARIETQDFKVNGISTKNIIASFGPETGSRIIVGAHYDVAGDQPGADDNASAVAGLIELSRLLSQMSDSLKWRIDLVAYTLEEPPFFKTEQMGSFVHAKSLKDEGIKIDLMISLEMIGYFSDDPHSQSFPIGLMNLFYPETGNFIAVVSDFGSYWEARHFAKKMKQKCQVPIERLSAPAFIPGVDYSDHLNYWHFGYKAIMITDTAFLRNKNYHKITDAPGTLNYSKMAEVINGVFYAITHP